MELTIEVLKRLDLADFLSRNYGLRFQRMGKQYACHSPFNGEKRPSFFVHMVAVGCSRIFRVVLQEASLTSCR